MPLPQLAAAAPAVLAHQGGWDEMLLVAAPIGLFAWILHVANKRADAHRSSRAIKGTDDVSSAASDHADRPDPG